jgi:glycosyltransferase involved in cell wall biosynthesis
MVTLSVVMPNFNHSKLLPHSLNALLNQSFKDFEIIVVDDASTDNSLSVLENFAKSYANLKIIKNSTNLGPNKSFQKGANEAQGQFMAMCSADDLVLPGFFEECITMLQKNPQAGLCTSIFTYYYEEDPNTVLMNFRHSMNSSVYMDPDAVCRAIQKYNFWIAGNSTIFKTDSLKKLGFLLDELKSKSDWFASHTIAFREGACFVPKNLALFRVSKKSYNNASKKNSFLTNQKIIEMIQSINFQDIESYFLKSGIFFQFENNIFKILLKTPKYWQYIPRILFNKNFPLCEQNKVIITHNNSYCKALN